MAIHDDNSKNWKEYSICIPSHQHGSHLWQDQMNKALTYRVPMANRRWMGSTARIDAVEGTP